MVNADASRPERIDTDSSLQAERDKTDDEIVKRASAVDEHVDGVVELARERADELIDSARQQADATLRAADAPAAVVEELTATRASEDDAVAAERAAADDRLEAERVEQKQALLLLLALERQETNAHLLMERERADRVVASRDDFLAMVSHDVRGILAGMAMSADLLSRAPADGAAPDVVHREAQRVQRLTGRMNRLIGDLLDVVSMESGRLDMVAISQDPGPLVSETLETFQLGAATRTIALTAEHDGSGMARFDHGRILQVLSNLVGNALKFTPPGGAVGVRLAATDGGVQFTVRDTGCGIAADQLEAIFERFAQSSTHDRRGLGLGLYIARSIVTAHGGTLWAESEPGRGSAFHFTLPAAA